LDWLPFAANVGGAVAAFDCADPNAATTAIHVVDWHRMRPDESASPVAPSLGQVVRWWIEAFDGGAYYYGEPQGLLQRNEGLIPDDRRRLSWLV